MYNQVKTTDKEQDKGFYALLAIVFILPLPWGSHAVWAEIFLLNFILLICFFWMRLHWMGRAFLPKHVKATGFVLLVLGLWWLYIGLLLLPLPSRVLEVLSPQAWYWHQQVNPQLETGWLSLDWQAGLRAWLRTSAYILLFILILFYVRRQAHIRGLVYALVISGVFQAVYGSVMTLSGWEWGFFYEKTAYQGVATGTFVNRNHLAAYLVMCLSMGIGLLLSLLSDKHWDSWRQFWRYVLEWLLSEKMLLRLALVLMVIALVLTHSRMGNTSFFVALLLASVLGLLLFRQAPRATVILLISLVIIDIFIVGAWFGLENVAQRLEQTTLEHETRDEVNVESLTYWQDYFWTGSGLGSYYGVFRQYQSADTGELFYDHAHNDYLQFATETGSIGLLLLALLLVSSFFLALKTLYIRRTPLLRGVAFAVIMATIALSIHSSVDFNLQIPANAATFMVILALGWTAAYFSHHKPRSRHLSSKQPGNFMQKLLLMSILLGLFSIGYVANKFGMSHFYATEAAFYMNKLSQAKAEPLEPIWRQALAQTQKALSWNPHNADALHRMGIVQTLFAEQFAATDEERQAALYKAIRFYQQALELRPAFAVFWANLALAKYQAGLPAKEWEAALLNAERAAPWQQYPLQVVVQIGVQRWFKLSAEGQKTVIAALERGLLYRDSRKQYKFRQQIARFFNHSRYRLAICRSASLPKAIAEHCQ